MFEGDIWTVKQERLVISKAFTVAYLQRTTNIKIEKNRIPEERQSGKIENIARSVCMSLSMNSI
jgi:hypothetical protein